jgi:autotransporter-associated beta strand protein
MTIANAITLAGGGLGSIEVSGTVTTTGLITLTGGTDFRGSNLIIGGGITSANNSGVSFNPTTTVNSTISIGTGDLTISSATTRINTAGNTFGNTSINFNGNLTLGINNALPTSTKVRFGFSSAANSVATLNLNGYNQTVASLEGASGNYDTQNQNITGGGVLTVNQIAAQAFSYGGRITDGVSATSLTKNGSGTLMLQNWSGINSSYSGATTINVGTLMILAGNGTSLSASSAYTVASGAVLSVNGTSQRIGSLAGSGTVQNGNATTATTLTVGVDNTSTTFSGILQNGGAAALALTKNGSGALTLSGSNTYSGGSTLNTGTLVIGHANAVGTGTFTQSSGSSLLKIDTTGTIANTMSVYNVQASQSATLSGAITVNNASFDVDSGDTLTLSGAVSGSGGVTKNGTGTLVLSSSNSYAAATTVNSGTLTAAAAGATGNSTVINVTGGSFLVTAANAVNDNAAVNLGGGRMAVSGNFDETVGLLTLSADSIIDFSGFAGTLRFGGIGSWASGATLAIWNWSGTTQYGTQINNYANPSNIVFTNNSNLNSNLVNISFYSDSGNSFVGNGFEVSGFSGGGSQIIAVPETETYFYAVALLAGVGVQFIRRRAKRKSLELYPQT